MKIKTLTIQNFKAFGPEQRFDFDGKNVLIYGNNGAGKSSIYYALHAFMQSSSPGKDWQKYFDSTHAECLQNTYVNANSLPSFIRLATDVGTNHVLATNITPDVFPSSHSTVALANLASDFLNYRLLFNFYNFRNSTDINLWDVFVKEVFPSWVYDELTNISFEQQLLNLEKKLKDLAEVIELNSRTGYYNTIGYKKPEYNTILSNIEEFNSRFKEKLRLLKPSIQQLLSTYFLIDEDVQIDIEDFDKLKILYGYRYGLAYPQLFLLLTINGQRVKRPQTFLNEARLTALALAIRLAMVGQKFKSIEGRDDLRILVLDDLLISLDMGNRMKVITYLQTNEDFKNYQLIILTHDKGFYERVKAVLAVDETAWTFIEMFDNTTASRQTGTYLNPVVKEKKKHIDLACHCLSQHDYDSCALYLRKELEQLLCIYYDPTLENLSRYAQLKTLFSGITGLQKDANGVFDSCLQKIAARQTLTAAEAELLKGLTVAVDGAADSAERQRVIKLNSFHKTVMTYLKQFYTDKARLDDIAKEMAALCVSVNELRGRLMNRGAHHGEEPHYETELHEGCEKVKAFKQQLFVFTKAQENLTPEEEA